MWEEEEKRSSSKWGRRVEITSDTPQPTTISPVSHKKRLPGLLHVHVNPIPGEKNERRYKHEQVRTTHTLSIFLQLQPFHAPAALTGASASRAQQSLKNSKISSIHPNPIGTAVNETRSNKVHCTDMSAGYRDPLAAHSLHGKGSTTWHWRRQHANVMALKVATRAC